MERSFQSGYKDLHAYQKSFELSLLIYRITKKFPQEEIFGLTSQMRRCASSVAANIAEGYGRKTKKDRLHFLYIARGSLNELEHHTDLALALNYLNISESETINGLREDTGKILSGLIRSLEQ
jgi:four helix bundle protein